MRRVFKPLSRQRHQWKERWFMRPFRLLLEHPAYWSLNRRNVTRAFAIGLFVSFVPLPVQMALGATLAILMRVNVPAAIAGTMFANPVTMVPMYLGAYWVGCWLLGMNAADVTFDMSWNWLTTTLVPIWKPFLLGCLVLGILSALAGYALLSAVWRFSVVTKYHRRRALARSSGSTNGEKVP
jgi:uncharacterized protein (DUF2062 family)